MPWRLRVYVGHAGIVVFTFDDAPAPVLSPLLTRAEAEVAALLVRGLTYLAIARRRQASRNTVANQASSIFRKLAVGSRAQLLARLLGERKERDAEIPGDRPGPAATR